MTFDTVLYVCRSSECLEITKKCLILQHFSKPLKILSLTIESSGAIVSLSE